MLVIWVLAALACILGVVAKPPAEPQAGVLYQLAELIRIVCTTALAISFLLGPGIVWRARQSQGRIALGFLPLPGLALLVGAGGVAWALAKPVGADVVCFAVAVPLLAWLLIGILRGGPKGMLSPDERKALLVVGCMLGLAIGRTLWSLGPDGELLAGTISRTLEVGDRPDSRIPFHVVQLVANGIDPYSKSGATYFFPYNFSSRGPLGGLASAPVVLLAGGRPPTSFPEQPWTPFDAQGFMAFRLAMMVFSSAALLSLWTLTKRLAGVRAAHFAVLLGATTPFLAHEVWFTWPKLLAASFVLLAAATLIGGRPMRAGLLVGVGYLFHPIALLSAPALILIALWPLAGARLTRPQIVNALRLLLGVATFFVAWRLVNGTHYTQGDFINYLTEAGPNIHATPWGQPLTWANYRLESLGNTLVPMMLAVFHGGNPAINVIGGTSPAVIHVFFQYWATLPFGIAIVFFPLLLLSLWRAWLRWKWQVFVAVVMPLATFTVYWGSYSTGMLREGLQAWILTLIAVVAIQQREANFTWLGSRAIRMILVLRAVELLALAMFPALATRHLLATSQFNLTDTVAVLAMVGFCASLGIQVWREGTRTQC
jgi:hypothetical protein